MAESHANRIYAILLDSLRTGAFGHDHRLVDTEVAAEHGVSRMPAREALLRLVAEGYLVSTTRGFTLPMLSEQEFFELLEVRRLLEPRAAADAARDLDEAHRTRLTQAMEAVREAHAADDLKALIRANMAFRNAWLEAVSNRRLAGIISRFMDHFQSIRLATFEDAMRKRAFIEGLEGLYEAFMRRDPLLAQDRMTGFMHSAEAAYVAAFRARQAQRRPPRRRSFTPLGRSA